MRDRGHRMDDGREPEVGRIGVGHEDFEASVFTQEYECCLLLVIGRMPDRDHVCDLALRPDLDLL